MAFASTNKIEDLFPSAFSVLFDKENFTKNSRLKGEFKQPPSVLNIKENNNELVVPIVKGSLARKQYSYKLYIKYMVSARCKMAVKEVLKKFGLHFIVVDLGEVEIMENISVEQREQLKIVLHNLGLELMDDKRAILVEKIKNVIIKMVHHTKGIVKKNISDFISEKLNYDYTYLANLFSEVQGATIEQFIISHKIERIKELIIYGELNITEIAWEMNYSSVAHLSNQFKQMTGLSPSHFKQLKVKRRSTIEEVGNITTISSN